MRLISCFAAALVATLGTALGQIALPTLQMQQFQGSNTIWLTPKQGQAINESDFFMQPGIEDQLTQEDELLLLKSRVGEGGVTHRHYHQFHCGHPVEGAVMITHSVGDQLKSANGILAYLPPTEEPAITDNEAVMLVQAKLGVLGPVASEGDDFEVSNVSLVYAPTTWRTGGGTLEYRLAYRVEILIFQPFSSSIAYIDARTGELFGLQSALQQCSQGTAPTLYNGWQDINAKYYNFLGTHYELRDDCRGELIHTRIDLHENADYDKFFKHSQCSDVKDGDNIWLDLEDQASASLHWAAEMFHDYLSARLGRDGLDGAGVKVKLVYHPTLLRYQTYDVFGNETGGDTLQAVNAYWDRVIKEAHFGRGDGVSPMVSLDVVSHELTHAFVSYEQQDLLGAGGETFALSESFGDIFGTCSEWYNIPLHDPGRIPDFTMGEDVALGPFRSMSDPTAFNLPLAFEGTNWDFGTNPDGHVNGSVQNYWFYLLAFGSWGKPTFFSIGVCGIGMNNAAVIAYRNITDYLGTASTFADARQGSILAAEALFGTGSNESIQCANAWAAVNVGPSASNCQPVWATIPNLVDQLALSMAPNPASTRLLIALHTSLKHSECHLSVWNGAGIKVAEVSNGESLGRGEHEWEIDCSDFPSGIYHLLFSSNRAQVCKKIAVIH